ncbi:MAG TPA: phosphate acyltransferase PlsX [Gammaproteobacteria bacterium]|nr:phosphate acyltransferase PlsX [Gammaproteobacteria bacterium]
MSTNYTISLDAMGGDFGPKITVPAALLALKEFDDIELILVGDKQALQQQVDCQPDADNNRLRIQHASQIVEMDESPALALRNKKDSSMRVAINLVKSAEANACVSAGNTGALMATAKFVLKMIPGVSRPAICTALPALGGHTHILDLGANIDCSSEQLFQFAVMGAALATAVDNNPNPSIGVLNVGAEAIKGSPVVKETGALLTNSNLNYIGFVEGDDIYSDRADVVVCDGFAGNVLLKTSEGLARMIQTYMKEEFLRNPMTKLAGLAAKPVLKAFLHRIDKRRYNGASLLGLKGVVIKSHGGADEMSFANAIKIARLEARQNIPEKIGAEVEQALTQ